MVNIFKWRHLQGVIILQCVRWYLKYGISYRVLEEMMKERGVEVDHSTLYRWVMKYAYELKKRSSWYARSHGFSWRVDETYVKVRGQWKYLYRAIDKQGDTIDFYLSHTRNKKAAKRFLSKALKVNKDWVPIKINTDQNPAVHFHTLCTDGVFVQAEAGKIQFKALAAPTQAEIMQVTERIAKKVQRWLKKRLEDCSSDELSEKEPLLSACYAASIRYTSAIGERAGSAPRSA